MRITGPSKAGPAEPKKSRKAGAGSGDAFAKALGDSNESAGAAAARPSGPVASVDALLSLQGEAEADAGREQGLARARDMLDLLEDVRRGILLGAIPRDKLHRLAETARSRREGFTDPQLGELLDEIELRAEVELAKLDSES